MALIRAVLDTNIYVSALLASKGESGRILEAGFERRLFVPVTSPAILDELIDVIARLAIMRRARRDLAQLAAFHRWVERKSEVVEGEYQELDIVFDGTRTPLTVWFTACWLFASGKRSPRWQNDGCWALTRARSRRRICPAT